MKWYENTELLWCITICALIVSAICQIILFVIEVFEYVA